MSEKPQKGRTKDSLMLPRVERGKGSAHGDRKDLARKLAHEKQLEEVRNEKLRGDN